MVQGCARPRRLPDRAAAAAAADRSGAPAELGDDGAQLLQSLFAVQGALTDAQAAAVAARAGCSAEAALEAFRALQSGAEAVVWRAGKRAAQAAADAAANGSRANGGAANGHGAAAALAAVAADPARVHAALAAAAAERQATLGKLRRLVNDPGDGGLRDAGATGAFVALMPELGSAAARGLAAAAVAASRSNIRAKLVAAAGFLTTLEAWLEAAKAARQHTLLLQLLAALRALPLGGDLLRSAGCAPLLRLVRRLQERAGEHARVQAAAAELLAQWQALQAHGGSSGAATATQPQQQQQRSQQQVQRSQQQVQPAGSGGVSANGSASAAARHPLPDLVPLGRGPSLSVGLPPRPGSAGEVAAPAVRGYQSLAAAGSAPARPARVSGPLSADDIRRERERKAAQARLQQLRAKEAGAGGAAAPGGEQRQAAATLPSQQRQQQQQQQQQQRQQQQRVAVPPRRATELLEPRSPKRLHSDSDDDLPAQQPAGAQPRSPKRARPAAPGGQRQQEQPRLPAWRPPPDATLPPPGPGQHHEVAWGEDSVEARARAHARSRQPPSTRAEVEPPLLPEPEPAQPRAAIPYEPTDPQEAREQDARLRDGGWRPAWPGAA